MQKKGKLINSKDQWDKHAKFLLYQTYACRTFVETFQNSCENQILDMPIDSTVQVPCPQILEWSPVMNIQTIVNNTLNNPLDLGNNIYLNNSQPNQQLNNVNNNKLNNKPYFFIKNNNNNNNNYSPAKLPTTINTQQNFLNNQNHSPQYQIQLDPPKNNTPNYTQNYIHTHIMDEREQIPYNFTPQFNIIELPKINYQSMFAQLPNHLNTKPQKEFGVISPKRIIPVNQKAQEKKTNRSPSPTEESPRKKIKHCEPKQEPLKTTQNKIVLPPGADTKIIFVRPNPVEHYNLFDEDYELDQAFNGLSTMDSDLQEDPFGYPVLNSVNPSWSFTNNFSNNFF